MEIEENQHAESLISKETDSNSHKSSKKSKDSKKKKEEKILDQALKTLSAFSSPAEKLEALCKKYIDLIDDNKKQNHNLRSAEKRIIHLEKERDHLQSEQTKSALSRNRLELLCRELQRQNKLMKEENLQRIREEEERRKEVSAKFQSTLSEITFLMKQNTESNSKLREENMEMQEQFKGVYEQYELREQQVEKISKQMKLEGQLAEAKLAKAQLELQAQKEVLEHDKAQLLAEIAMYQHKCQQHEETEASLKAQINAYYEKYDEFQTVLTRSNQVYSGFKTEIEKMSKKITKLEKETASWKEKWEGTHKALLALAAEKQLKDAENALQGKQLLQLQKLCRTLQAERSSLVQQLNNQSTSSTTPAKDLNTTETDELKEPSSTEETLPKDNNDSQKVQSETSPLIDSTSNDKQVDDSVDKSNKIENTASEASATITCASESVNKTQDESEVKNKKENQKPPKNASSNPSDYSEEMKSLCMRKMYTSNESSIASSIDNLGCANSAENAGFTHTVQYSFPQPNAQAFQPSDSFSIKTPRGNFKEALISGEDGDSASVTPYRKTITETFRISPEVNADATSSCKLQSKDIGKDSEIRSVGKEIVEEKVQLCKTNKTHDLVNGKENVKRSKTIEAHMTEGQENKKLRSPKKKIDEKGDSGVKNISDGVEKTVKKTKDGFSDCKGVTIPTKITKSAKKDELGTANLEKPKKAMKKTSSYNIQNGAIEAAAMFTKVMKKAKTTIDETDVEAIKLKKKLEKNKDDVTNSSELLVDELTTDKTHRVKKISSKKSKDEVPDTKPKVTKIPKKLKTEGSDDTQSQLLTSKKCKEEGKKIAKNKANGKQEATKKECDDEGRKLVRKTKNDVPLTKDAEWKENSKLAKKSRRQNPELYLYDLGIEESSTSSVNFSMGTLTESECSKLFSIVGVKGSTSNLHFRDDIEEIVEDDEFMSFDEYEPLELPVIKHLDSMVDNVLGANLSETSIIPSKEQILSNVHDSSTTDHFEQFCDNAALQLKIHTSVTSYWSSMPQPETGKVEGEKAGRAGQTVTTIKREFAKMAQKLEDEFMMSYSTCCDINEEILVTENQIGLPVTSDNSDGGLVKNLELLPECNNEVLVDLNNESSPSTTSEPTAIELLRVKAEKESADDVSLCTNDDHNLVKRTKKDINLPNERRLQVLSTPEDQSECFNLSGIINSVNNKKIVQNNVVDVALSTTNLRENTKSASCSTSEISSSDVKKELVDEMCQNNGCDVMDVALSTTNLMENTQSTSCSTSEISPSAIRKELVDEICQNSVCDLVDVSLSTATLNENTQSTCCSTSELCSNEINREPSTDCNVISSTTFVKGNQQSTCSSTSGISAGEIKKDPSTEIFTGNDCIDVALSTTGLNEKIPSTRSSASRVSTSEIKKDLSGEIFKGNDLNVINVALSTTGLNDSVQSSPSRLSTSEIKKDLSAEIFAKNDRNVIDVALSTTSLKKDKQSTCSTASEFNSSEIKENLSSKILSQNDSDIIAESAKKNTQSLSCSTSEISSSKIRREILDKLLLKFDLDEASQVTPSVSQLWQNMKSECCSTSEISCGFIKEDFSNYDHLQSNEEPLPLSASKEDVNVMSACCSNIGLEEHSSKETLSRLKHSTVGLQQPSSSPANCNSLVITSAVSHAQYIDASCSQANSSESNIIYSNLSKSHSQEEDKSEGSKNDSSALAEFNNDNFVQHQAEKITVNSNKKVSNITMVADGPNSTTKLNIKFTGMRIIVSANYTANGRNTAPANGPNLKPMEEARSESVIVISSPKASKPSIQGKTSSVSFAPSDGIIVIGRDGEISKTDIGTKIMKNPDPVDSEFRLKATRSEAKLADEESDRLIALSGLTTNSMSVIGKTISPKSKNSCNDDSHQCPSNSPGVSDSVDNNETKPLQIQNDSERLLSVSQQNNQALVSNKSFASIGALSAATTRTDVSQGSESTDWDIFVKIIALTSQNITSDSNLTDSKDSGGTDWEGGSTCQRSNLSLDLSGSILEASVGSVSSDLETCLRAVESTTIELNARRKEENAYLNGSGDAELNVKVTPDIVPDLATDENVENKGTEICVAGKGSSNVVIVADANGNTAVGNSSTDFYESVSEDKEISLYRASFQVKTGENKYATILIMGKTEEGSSGPNFTTQFILDDSSNKSDEEILPASQSVSLHRAVFTVKTGDENYTTIVVTDSATRINEGGSMISVSKANNLIGDNSGEMCRPLQMASSKAEESLSIHDSTSSSFLQSILSKSLGQRDLDNKQLC